jgi:hypothetical protein
MNDPEVLTRILEEAKREVEKWPNWMKSQEPSPSIPAAEVSCGHEDEQEEPDERLSA